MPSGISAISSRKETKASKSVEPAPSPPAEEASFHPFPKLPIEMRHEILGYLMPEARVVTIWSEGLKSGGLVDWERKELKKAGPEVAKIPTPLLHVNKEIREFAMSWYTLTFGEQLKGKAIFFDFNRDTLRFSHADALNRFCGTYTSVVPESQLAHLNEVGGKVRFLETHNSFTSSNVGLVSRFYNLELLTSNYEPKPHTERLLIKQWTERAKANGREVKIPRYRLKGGKEREMGA